MKILSLRQFELLTGACFLIAFLPILGAQRLNGEFLPVFLICFSLAGVAYILTIWTIRQKQISLSTVWIIAIIVRLIILSTTPTLSNDVYRYMWDGHILHQGINPYAEPVNSPKLDLYNTPLRSQVNHPEMATPYLPVAQVYFWVIEQIAPQQVKAYQIATMIFDLLTGLVILRLLNHLHLKPAAVLVYLWNPLVIVEFTHSAHVDVVMLFLTMTACSFMFSNQTRKLISPLILALATLTKGLPLLFMPLWMRWWRIKGLILYLLVMSILLAAFAICAGSGLGQIMDGRGLFGAARIYTQYWQFNAGPLFNIINTWPGLESEFAGRIARWIIGGLALAGLIWSTHRVWKIYQLKTDPIASHRALIRLSLLPVGIFLLLSPTVHPWYITWILPFLPFFIPAEGEPQKLWRWIIPWVYFSITIAFSYLAYRGPGISEVPTWVLWVEYLPLYACFAWIVIPTRLRFVSESEVRNL